MDRETPKKWKDRTFRLRGFLSQCEELPFALWVQEEGQLGAFSASRSWQACFLPASGSRVFISKIERLRFG